MKRYILIASVIILSALAAPSANASTLFQPPNNNGLLAWWPLDEGNGTVAHDLSGNGNTGTLNNFTTTSGVDSPTWTTGQFGNAVSFNASNGQYVVASSSGVFNYSQSWTISAWVNISNFVIQFPFSLVTNTGSPSAIPLIRIRPGGVFDTVINNANLYIASTTLTTGSWHNLMVVWDSSANTLAFYKDGVSVGTTPVTTAPSATPIREFVLGARAFDFLLDLQGSLDDVRLYQRALSSSEAANIYSGGTVSSSNLVGWWKFDEGSGYSAADSSGNGQTAYFSQEGWVTGKKGRALAFRGTDSTARSITTNLTNATGDGTIAVWFKAPGQFSDTSRTEHLIVGAGDPTDGMSTSVAWIYIKSPWAETAATAGTGPAGALSFLWNCPNCNSGANRLDTNKPYDDGQWHFAVMTQSGGTMTGYVDGTLVGTAPAATSIDATYPYYIGSVKTDSWAWNFGGAIDDVRVYNRALSAAEVKTLYSAGQVTRKVVSGSGLAGWWTFNEGTSTIAHDFSGNGGTGTINGTVSWVAGKRGGALSFDGTTYVQAPLVSGVAKSGTYTFSAWVNSSNSSAEQSIFDNPGSPNNCNDRNGMVYYAGTQDLSFGYYDGSAWHGVSGKMTPNSWHQVVGINTGGVLSLYIDNVLQSQSVNPYATCSNVLTIGKTASQPFPFYGSIDDVRFYTRALSAGEVTALYKENSTRIGHSQENVGPTSGLVGYWSFNGIDMNWTNSTAIDSSPQGNNGSLVNMTQSTAPVAGKVGQALNFVAASSQYVNVGNPASLQISSGGITISAWAKFTPDGNHQVILSHGAGGYVSYLHYQTGTYYLCWARSTVTNNGCYNFAALAVPTDGKWHNYVQVADINASTVTAYIDGQLKMTTGFSAAYSYLSNVYIGYSQEGGSYYFNGPLDEVRVYNRALSASEVKQLYQLGH